MKALPWLIALTLLALNLIQQDRVNRYKDERDVARAEFRAGAEIFWSNQAEAAAVRSAYRLRQIEMGLRVKQQKLIIDAYEEELNRYRRERSGAIPE